jgi:hypothetical protein
MKKASWSRKIPKKVLEKTKENVRLIEGAYVSRIRKGYPHYKYSMLYWIKGY